MTQSRIRQKGHLLWQRYRTNDSVRLSVIVSAMVLLLFCANAADDLAPLTKIDYTIVSMVGKIILFLLLLCSVKSLWRRMTGEKLAGLLFVALLFGVSFCISEERSQVWRLLRQYCLTVLPIVVVISCIDDHQVLLDSLLGVSRVIAVCAVILLVSLITGDEFCIQTVVSHQFLMCAALDYFSMIQNDYFVTIPDR